MRRFRRSVPGLAGACVLLVATAGLGAGALAAPERTTRSDLADKRYVAAGDRAYVIGTTDGGFPAMGWHIRGEMGGVWAHPIKLLDGYWFKVNNGWLPAAEAFTTGPGYVRMDYPQARGVRVSRIEFSPDGSPVVLVGLELRNVGGGAAAVNVEMQARSEIMAAYPWGWSEPFNAKEFNNPDTGSFDAATGTLRFQESGKPWHAVVGASQAPHEGDTGDGFWGPLTAEQQAAHTEMGNGTGGRLAWRVQLPVGGSKTLWIGVAGSQSSSADAYGAMRSGVTGAAALLAAKIAHRRELLGRTDVDLPDAGLEAAFDWGKLNMQDLRRTVTDMEVRDVDEGRAYPPPVGTLPEATGIGAGYPDYPWYFGTDGAYTAFPLVVSGQWDTAKEHLRTIRDASRILNGGTGKVVHEVVTDGSVYFGANDDPGNTNETAQFATAVHLIWSWSGDNGFRDEMYEFVRDGLRYVMSADCVTTCDKDQDNWPEGNGMVERTGMGSEKLDVTAYTWQALRSLQDMALSKGDSATAAWADSEADAMESSFDPTWWMEQEALYADSLCNAGDAGEEGTNVCTTAGQQLQQRHWINATPMEVVLAGRGLSPEIGDGELATREHANAALDTLEGANFTGDCGLFHTGAGGGPTGAGELKCWTLPSSVMATAEANYGRLGDDQALRYMRTISDQLDLEQPGALPEIVPSPEYDPFVDFRDRAMFMQAWSSYGVQWPVVHHFLGVRPNVPSGRLAVVPDVPDSWPGLSVESLRVGGGVVATSASVEGNTYTTTVDAPAGYSLTIGHTLPTGAEVASVTLDGAPVAYEVVDTTRGREVRVEASSGTQHTLEVERR